MISISLVVITFNEEKNIARCLDSAKDLVDEVIVVDSFSSDRTENICREQGVRFVQHTFDGHIEQKNFALMQANSEYVLSLDADEWLSEELRKSVAEIKKSPPAEAYQMNRLSRYAGRWIRTCGWYPDRKIRLWKKTAGHWGGYNPHDKVVLEPGVRVAWLKGDILHDAYQSVDELIAKTGQYARIYAQEHRFRKNSSLFKIIYKTVFHFIDNYFFKLGFTDGYEGLLIAYSNTSGVFYKYAQLLEANKKLNISLIITTYNRPEALELVLLSVFEQTLLPDEIIIADDGSGEETRLLIEKLRSQSPVPLSHCWQPDTGFRLAQIRNKAIAQANGEYLVMIDGDMVLHPAFVKDHRKAARKGYFVQGSRVLLDEKGTQESITGYKTRFYFWQSHIYNRFNALHLPSLSRWFIGKKNKLTSIRGANMSFWREDCWAVNGFNEAFVGWGREDSEFVARLFNHHIFRKNLKFGGIAYHLFHPESQRTMVEENERILEATIREQRQICKEGINQYLDTKTKKVYK
jgi:glycosyltransferase involved in cell wall biosynthesis